MMMDFKKSQTIKTPFGALNIYVDEEIINYLPVKVNFEHPTCKERPLAACYRISIKLKGKRLVKCVIEPPPECDAGYDTGEDYICHNFVKDNIQLTIGTIDHYDDPKPYVVNPLTNGFCFSLFVNEITLELGVAWVVDRAENDLRTWFAADPYEK